MSLEEATSYQAGIDAREAAREKSTNPYPHMTNKWSWWLAGWNDRDIALARPLNSLARSG